MPCFFLTKGHLQIPEIIKNVCRLRHGLDIKSPEHGIGNVQTTTMTELMLKFHFSALMRKCVEDGDDDDDDDDDGEKMMTSAMNTSRLCI